MLRKARSSPDPDIAGMARLIGHPVRTAMLFALLDGGQLTAAELARRSGASPQAASAHLTKLVNGRCLAKEVDGRRRLFHLASPDVGAAIEALAALARPPRIVALSQNVALQRLRVARSCYDHLAGIVGVGVFERLTIASNASTGPVAVTEAGRRLLRRLGIDLTEGNCGRRPYARACLDWTERRPHLAGALGHAVLRRFFAAGWVRRRPGDRSLIVTAAGRRMLIEQFDLDPGDS